MSRINVANFRHPDATADSITVTSDGDTQINRALGLGGATYGSSGQVLTSAGSGSTPTWTTPTSLSNAEDGAGTNFEFNSGFGSNGVAYGVRAWVNLNGTGTVAIRSSGNCSSITDVSVGQYQFNFATEMPDANYAAVSEVRVDTTGENTRIGNTTYSTAQFEIEVTTAGNTSYSDSDLVNIIVVR